MKKRIVISIVIVAIVITITTLGVFIYAISSRGGALQAKNTTKLSIGKKYLTELNYEKAIATLEHVITIEPNNTEAYLVLAKAYRYMGDIDTACKVLENGYGITNSTVIERELLELLHTDNATNDTQTFTNVSTVLIAGNSYPTDVTELVLRDCGLTNEDLSKISELTKLERLDISGNNISDISAIESFTNLKKFYAANNTISDISPLAGLESLEYVGLRGNRIMNADALFTNDNLKYLHLSNNQITTVTRIGSSLQLLYLANNSLYDTTPIKNATLLYYDINNNGNVR